MNQTTKDVIQMSFILFVMLFVSNFFLPGKDIKHIASGFAGIAYMIGGRTKK